MFTHPTLKYLVFGFLVHGLEKYRANHTDIVRINGQYNTKVLSIHLFRIGAIRYLKMY